MASGSAPTVPDVHATTAEDTQLDGNLLSSATDPEQDTLLIISHNQFTGGFGFVSINNTTGAYTFTPTANANGSGSIYFTVSDGTNSVQAHLYITITPVNDAPACAGRTTSGAEDAQQSGTIACTDVDSASLTYALVDQAAHGTAAVNADGTWTYTPGADFSGSDSFTFKANDGALDSNTATMGVTVTAVNDAPACAGRTTSGAEDAQQSGTIACTDVDSASLTYALVDQAAHGTAAVNADGTWTYTPGADFSGSDSFTFKANDGALDSNTATMGVTVTAVNDAPACATPVTSEGGLGHQQAGTFGCTDVDSASLTYALVAQAAHGTAVVNANGSWTYTPTSATFHGTDSFTFKANDGALDSNTATVSITVDADTTAPTVAMPTLSLATARIDESAPIKISWSATDAETGVGSYVVQQKVGTAAWTTIYSGTATSVIRSYPFSVALYWRVMATDRAGNPSAWKTTTVHSVGAYQEGSSLVTRSGTWSYVASSGSSGTGYRYTTTYLRYAQLRFGGIQVLYVAPKLSSGGYVKLYVDGAYRGRYSTYRSSTLLGQVIAGAAWGTSGTHTIKIVNAQSGHRTTLDAFIVLR